MMRWRSWSIFNRVPTQLKSPKVPNSCAVLTFKPFGTTSRNATRRPATW